MQNANWFNYDWAIVQADHNDCWHNINIHSCQGYIYPTHGH